MKRLLLAMAMVLLLSTSVYAAQRMTLSDGNDEELGTSTNPLYVTGISGGGESVWQAESSVISPSLTNQGSDLSIGNALYVDHSERNVRLTAQTASTLIGLDASKNIVTLATATYPSLTEFSYVKGLTGAIMTLINGKQATVTEGSLSDSVIVSADIKDGEVTGSDMNAVIDLGGKTSFEGPNGTSGTTDATGEEYFDTNGDGGTNFSGSVKQIYNGSANVYLFPCALPLAASQDNYVQKYDASTKTISWEADADTSISGTDTHVMFFDGANTPAGEAGFTYNKTTDSATLAGSVTVSKDLTSSDAVFATKFIGTGAGAGSLVLEGTTADAYETTLSCVDPTADRAINLPNASGTVAVSATAPVTLSAAGDVGLTVAKDIVAGTGISGGEDNVLPGADADTTLTFAPAELEGVTWGGGAQATIVHTFDVSGTDGTVTYGSALATFSHDIQVNGDDIQLGATGVKITDDTDGAITFLGCSEGSDEDFTINLDDTADNIVFSSSTSAATIIGLANYSLGSAGVKLTGDGDGALTILGLGNGSDEDLTLNLDDTDNTAVISSSTGVTSINTGAIGVYATGDILGGVRTAAKTSAYTIGTDLASEAYGGIIYVTTAATMTLPAVADGMSCTVITIGDIAVSLDTNASDKMYLDGVLLDDGDKATNNSKSGDTIIATYYSADGWYCTSFSNDATDKDWDDTGA